MKRIGIDARLYFQTGVGVYTRNLLHYLESLNTENLEFYIYVLAEDSAKIQFKKANFHLRLVTARWHSFAEQITFLLTLYRDKLDLMHFTYFSHPVLYKKPFIATVHDTILLQMKTGKASTKSGWWYSIKHTAFAYALKNQIQNGLKIITPTEEIKKQLVSLYGTQYEKKIVPIYEGVNYELLDAQENVSLQTTQSKPFFMYVGNFYPHKNVERLIEAYQRARIDAELLLIGPNDFFSKRLRESFKGKNITFKHNVSNEDLKWYYKHTLALIHPSLSEGFGLPLIEATHFGCPVIASDIPVFRELLGTKYISFDPHKIEEISDRISEFDQVTSRIEQSNAQRFSFKRMSEEILNLYENSNRL